MIAHKNFLMLVLLVATSGCSGGSMSFISGGGPEKPKPPATASSLMLLNRHQIAAAFTEIFGNGLATSNALLSTVRPRGAVLGGSCDVYEVIRAADGTPADMATVCHSGMPETRYPAEGNANTLGMGFVSHACELITRDIESIKMALNQVPGVDWGNLQAPGQQEIQSLFELFYPSVAVSSEVMRSLETVSAAVAAEPTDNQPADQYSALLLTICLTGAWLVL